MSGKNKCIFLDRDGVLNIDTDLINKPEDLYLYDFTADAVKKINGSNYKAIVTTNQSIIARNLTNLDGLKSIHDKMEKELANQDAYLDAIYFCPHHNTGNFENANPDFVTICECRKPKPGMINAASAKFDIDKSLSWMIGDSERDVLSGKAAGVTTIGVMTGHGLKNTNEKPDYFFGNLKHAVDFIIDNPYASLFEDLCFDYQNDKHETPYIITIDGASRSGKSTLAAYLNLAFQKVNISCKVISIDDLQEPHNQTVETEIQKSLGGGRIAFANFRSHPKRPIETVDYHFKKEKVVIIEGNNLLDSDYIKSISNKSVYLTVDAIIQQERLLQYYDWLGLDKEDAKLKLESLHPRAVPSKADFYL